MFPYDTEDLVLVGVAALIVAAIGFVAYVSGREQIAWEAFSKTHECRVVGKESSSVGVGYGITSGGSFGVVTTTTPGKTGYACNDGVTYWR